MEAGVHTAEGFFRLQRKIRSYGAWALLATAWALLAAPGAYGASAAVVDEKPTELDEALVKGRRGLDQFREAMVRVEDQFYARFNELNSDDDFDVHCATEVSAGTRLKRRYCRANFEADAQEAAGENHWDAEERTQRIPPMPWEPPIPARVAMEPRRRAFREDMIKTATEHPELLELLRQRAALAERYEKLRRESFGIDRKEEEEPE
jgi:hypothetical protein